MKDRKILSTRASEPKIVCLANRLADPDGNLHHQHPSALVRSLVLWFLHLTMAISRSRLRHVTFQLHQRHLRRDYHARLLQRHTIRILEIRPCHKLLHTFLA